MLVYLGFVSVIFFIIYLVKRKSPPTVIDIVVYPIKSCAGIHLASAQINEYGILFDRYWVIVDQEKKLINQHINTSVLKLKPKLKVKNGILTSVELMYEDKTFEFLPQTIGEVIESEYLGVMNGGIDEGKNVASFLQEIFQQPYRLIRILRHRQINHHPRFRGTVGDENLTTFNSYAQFLILSEESHLKTKKSIQTSLKNELDIGCFRGNIIIRGVKPFEEDSWARFTIGEVEFEGIGRNPRCKSTIVHQETLKYDEHSEPLRTLRRINGNGAKGYLGMHCIRHNNGKIRLGQPVLVKEIRKFPDI